MQARSGWWMGHPTSVVATVVLLLAGAQTFAQTATPTTAASVTPTPTVSGTPAATPTPAPTFAAGGALADPDGDGLKNEDEIGAGTSQTLADTDGDYFLDGEEVAAGSNPLDPASFPGSRVDDPIDTSCGMCGQGVAPALALMGAGLVMALGGSARRRTSRETRLR